MIKCKMFLRLESFKWILAPNWTNVFTVCHPLRDAASSNGDRFSLSRALMSAPYRKISTECSNNSTERFFSFYHSTRLIYAKIRESLEFEVKSWISDSRLRASKLSTFWNEFASARKIKTGRILYFFQNTSLQFDEFLASPRILPAIIEF